MPNVTPFRMWVLLLVSLLLVGGCGDEKKKKVASDTDASELPEVPRHLQGTVAEFARPASGGYMPVQGYGLVIGLGDKGSPEVPASLRRYFEQELARADFGSWVHETAHVSPQRVLRDRDTAVVEAAGAIPYGAPKGTRFDILVSCVPQTSTLSLDGGFLMPCELRFTFGASVEPGRGSRAYGHAGGELFVNPFVDPTDANEVIKFREGILIGGGEVTEERPVKLILREPDYALARSIRDRINERFRLGNEPIANARSRAIIDITVPPQWRADYEHFIDLVLHLPLLRHPGEWEARGRELVEQFELPGAAHHDIALTLEAMGPQVIPLLRPLYASTHPDAAYHAARTGLRLGDDAGAGVVVRFAGMQDSPLQLPAIHELARHRNVFTATDVLHRLLDGDNALTRIAAYETLAARGDAERIQRLSVGEAFTVDLVRTSGAPVIYATQSERSHLVVFGHDLSVVRPLFFCAPDELLTVNARPDAETITVYRKVPITGKMSDAFYIEPNVGTLLQTLGNRPLRDKTGRILGLGLTYGQVIRMTHLLCEGGHIPAKFILQPPPALKRIYEDAATVERPEFTSE